MARAGSSQISELQGQPQEPKPGQLFLVATPLGNLQDLTFRAVEVLRSVAVVACEDTRHSRKLLGHYGVGARLISCHEHNEETAARQIVSVLESGLDVALVSDAGTPGISDPGYRAVCLTVARGFNVVPVPGPSAVASAVSVSGLPTDRFMFAGFLPPKLPAIKSTLQELAALRATLVFYCPARRLRSALKAASEVLGDRRAVVCRELTKVHEQVARGTLIQLGAAMDSGEIPARGEVVLLVEGQVKAAVTESAVDLASQIAALLEDIPQAGDLGAKQLTVLAAARTGAPRNRVYPLVCAWLNRRG